MAPRIDSMPRSWSSSVCFVRPLSCSFSFSAFSFSAVSITPFAQSPRYATERDSAGRLMRVRLSSSSTGPATRSGTCVVCEGTNRV